MEYCDAHSKENLINIFPEVVASSLVDVTHVVNLDEEKLSMKVKGLYDFVIMNHVIEHVANPLAVFLELFNVVKTGGVIIISDPDKEFTFDNARELTSFEHLLEEFKSGVSYVEDDHYLDFIQHTAPEIYNSGDKKLLSSALKSARDRREHAHVWNSESFIEFLQESIKYLELDVQVETISIAKYNNFECFVVLRKNSI
jgi:SAM-dependent methyltransferase